MVKIAYAPIYAHPLPEGHRFPMEKYELIPQQLLLEGVVTTSNFFEPTACPINTVALTHNQDYINKLLTQTLSKKEERAIGFPQSLALTQRELIITQGTIDCCTYAMQHGAALNVAGGTHHAFADRGEGFCLLNDFGVAANYLLQQNSVQKILIIDLDVHQGNGTASLFYKSQQVFTFSMHGAHNYPFKKEQSHIDIGLADGTDTATYLNLLKENLATFANTIKPDIIFYLSGVDILDTDKFGKLKVSLEGCKERDRLVFEFCKQLNCPVVVAMGGGYSPQIKTIVTAHCNTFKMATHYFG
jgi:acetoin utilization deacetylase AcuC-like enzyme